jgi:hypothetical protein
MQPDTPAQRMAIGKIIVLALITFFVWGYGSSLAAKLGLF